MATKVFINHPVKDLERSTSFFTQLGYRLNQQYTDDKAACLAISDNIFVMLLIQEYFQTFITKSICDAKVSTEVLIALDAPSREAVMTTVAKAKELGAVIYSEPQDHGWMYQHSFADLDGHQWELVYMDESKIPGAGQNL